MGGGLYKASFFLTARHYIFSQDCNNFGPGCHMAIGAGIRDEVIVV